MTDYQKYINALRKCAKEHENDRTSTGHIIVSDLCRDTANLLEALEKEPTTKNNLAVEKTDMIDKSNFSQEQYKTDLQSAYDCGFEAGKKAEQEPRWIPVSERLPKAEYGESDSVLVCFENETQDVLYFDGSNWCYPTGETYISVNHENGWHNKVIAWMPLPKPYKAESEE